MAADFLRLNRHGTLYCFRRAIPKSLQGLLGRTCFIKSLNTGKRSEATVAARRLTAITDELFHRLRMASEDEPLRAYFNEVWVTEFEIAGTKHKVTSQITDIKPGEEEAASRYANETRTRAIAEAIAASNGLALATPLSAPVIASNRGKLAKGKTILEVFEEFASYKLAIGAKGEREGWSNPGRVSVEQLPHIRNFVEFIEGDCPIEEITEEEVLAFHEYVMTTDTITSEGSRKTRLNRTAAVFKYAKKNKRYIANDFSDEFAFTGKIKRNSFLKFTEGDLRKLFESDAYRNHKHQTTSQYWLPLLGLFTGARINELCQLLRSDIQEREGIRVFSILDEEENKRLKTDAARRFVPIHSRLIELGFLDFVKTVPATGRLFPHLRESPIKPGDFGQKASEDFTDYRRSVDVGNLAGEGKSRKAFHSFRATHISALRKAEVSDGVRRRLVGHEFDDTHDRNYDGGDPLDMYSMETLRNAIERVQFQIAFSSFRASG